MKFPDQYRAQHPMGYDHKPGDPFGWFMIPFYKKNRGEATMIAVQADAQTEWEHISASIRGRTPTWEEMCYLKNLFWDEEDCVVQYHPPKSEYVNLAKNCLHLWRYRGEMPRPPKEYVG